MNHHEPFANDPETLHRELEGVIAADILNMRTPSLRQNGASHWVTSTSLEVDDFRYALVLTLEQYARDTGTSVSISFQRALHPHTWVMHVEQILVQP